MSLATEMTSAFNEIYNLLKEEITYQSLSRSYDSNDNLTETATESSVNVVVEILDIDTVNELGGLLNVGDAIMYFQGTESLLVKDKLVHNSITYSIDRIIPHNTGSTTNFYEVHCKREHD